MVQDLPWPQIILETTNPPSQDILTSALLLNHIDYDNFSEDLFPPSYRREGYVADALNQQEEDPTEDISEGVLRHQDPPTRTSFLLDQATYHQDGECKNTSQQNRLQVKNQRLGPHTRCINCGTSTTSLWRRAKDTKGSPICNSCGLYEKLHNTRRPVAMRKDSVLRRKRKTPPRGRRKNKKQSNILVKTEDIQHDHSYQYQQQLIF